MTETPRLKDDKGRFSLGTWLGVTVTGDRTVLVGLAIVLAVNSLLAALFLRTYLLDSLVAVLLTVAVHWTNETLHHGGHLLAGRFVGKPMKGMHYFLMLARSIYPRDEGEVAPKQHITRALGGPVMSVFVAMAWGVLAGVAQASPLISYVFAYGALSSLIVFSLMALAPVRFLDGGSILYWWGKLRENQP